MNFLIFFSLVTALSSIVCDLFPFYKQKIELLILRQANELSVEMIENINSPSQKRSWSQNYIFAFILLNISTITFIINKNDLWLAIFVLLFALAAYIDALCNWVPDPLIYGITWYTMIFVIYHFHPVPIEIKGHLYGVVSFVAPMILTNIIVWFCHFKRQFASGDLIIAIPIGLWIKPEYSLLVIGFAMVFANFFSIYTKRKTIPFLPFLFISFNLVNLSQLS